LELKEMMDAHADWHVTHAEHNGRWDVVRQGGGDLKCHVRDFPEVIRVRPGNTLSGIARLYGTTDDGLARINGIKDKDMIYVGQKLVIR
jgi:hypothetical protein